MFKYITPEEEAKSLTKIVPKSAYMFFLDKHFKEVVNFNKQSKVEQDRMLNELTAAAIVLLLSIINDKLADIESNQKISWEMIYKKFPIIFKRNGFLK